LPRQAAASITVASTRCGDTPPESVVRFRRLVSQTVLAIAAFVVRAGLAQD